MPRNLLTEASATAQATPVAGGNGRFRLELITPGWGSSGYYPASVLEAAGAARVFPAGTHMYLDHPTASDRIERPERSVRDLAAVLAEDAVWDPTSQALVAEATVFGNYREVLTEMADAIGVSVIALADVAPGEAEGRRGTIVSELVEGRSVDFVTRAGRGGRIAQVIESAAEVTERRNIGQWIESRLHRDFTITADDMAGDGRLTREERISLSAAIGDALAAFVARLEADQPQLYTRDLWDDPQDTIAAAIEAASTDVTATRPDSTTTTEESEEDTMPEIAESELARLREDAGRVQTLESELSTERTARETVESERDAARAETAQLRAHGAAVTHARNRVTEANGDLPQPVVDRIVEAATRTVPLTESGQLDTAALDTAVDAARTAEEAYVARLAEATGAGRVRTFGATRQTTGTGTAGTEGEVTEADVDAMIARRAGTEKKGA